MRLACMGSLWCFLVLLLVGSWALVRLPMKRRALALDLDQVATNAGRGAAAPRRNGTGSGLVDDALTGGTEVVFL